MPGIVTVERVIASIPILPFTVFPDTTFCGPGSGSIVNQGAILYVALDSGRQDTYNWTFTYPAEFGGRVVDDTVTTSSFAVDPRRMNVTRGCSY